jgi:hypothetical protein
MPAIVATQSGHFEDVAAGSKRALEVADVRERVNRVVLAVDRSLPVYPDEQIFSVLEGMSQMGHGTKSLRDNPLRRAA